MGVLQVSFWVWVPSLSLVSSGSVHMGACRPPPAAAGLRPGVDGPPCTRSPRWTPGTAPLEHHSCHGDPGTASSRFLWRSSQMWMCWGDVGSILEVPPAPCPPTSRFTCPCTRLRSLCPPQPRGTGCWHLPLWPPPPTMWGQVVLPQDVDRTLGPHGPRTGSRRLHADGEWVRPSLTGKQSLGPGCSESNLLPVWPQTEGGNLVGSPGHWAQRPPACQCARPARGPLLPSDHSDAPRPPNPPPSLPALPGPPSRLCAHPLGRGGATADPRTQQVGS